MKDRPPFAFTVVDLKKKISTTKHDLMWAFAGKVTSGALGRQCAEWVFPLYPFGALRRGLHAGGEIEHSGMGWPNGIKWVKQTRRDGMQMIEWKLQNKME